MLFDSDSVYKFLVSNSVTRFLVSLVSSGISYSELRDFDISLVISQVLLELDSFFGSRLFAATQCKLICFAFR